jgi:hypothetical protein
VDLVVTLHCILNEDVVAHGVINNVLLDPEEVGPINGHCTVERLVHGVSSNIRVVYVSDHVEVDGVPAQLEGLSHVGEFAVAQPGCQGVVAI